MSKIIIALYVLTTSFALIFLKLGSKDGAPLQILDGKVQSNINAYSILGGLLYASSFIVYTYLISKYDIGFIIPLVTGFVYVFVFFASYFIFKEIFTPIKIVAILLIISGVILINFSSN